MSERIKKLFEPCPLYMWLLAELPLVAVLILTAALDPAEGYAPGSGTFYVYIPAALVTALIAMALNLAKGFLVLYFGEMNCGLLESGRLLGRVHSLMALLEALGNLLLFFVRRSAAFLVLTQLQLFGHELIYAALIWLYLREKSKASYKKCLVLALLCFLASSAWLLLSVIAGV